MIICIKQQTILIFENRTIVWCAKTNVQLPFLGMQSLSKFDLFGLSLSAALIFIFSAMYYSENFKYIQREQINSIGKIINIKNSAQIKQPKDFVWTDVQSTDFIQDNDSLFVGPNSEATILLDNSSQITLKENSMLSFTKNNSALDIALNFGEINAEKMVQRIEIDVCGKKEFIDPRDALNIEIKKSKNCQIEIKSKSGQIQFGEQKVSALKQIESSVIFSESKYEILPTPETEKPVQVTMGSDGPTTAQELTSEKIFQIFPAENPIPEELPLTKTEPVKSATVQPPKPQVIFLAPVIGPDDIKKNFYSQDKNSTNLYLRWKNTNTSTEVSESQFEMSESKNFKKILLTENTEKNSVLIKTQLTKGIYFWRVRFKSEQKYSDWSSVAQLSIF